MITVKTEPYDEGLRVTRVSTTDSVVDVPDNVNGVPVVSIGPAFMEGCRSFQGRTVRIPGTIREMDPCALDMTTGLSLIEYGGDIKEFSGFHLTSPSDCSLACTNGGKRFTFPFPSNMPMSFPEFDEVAMSSFLSIPMDVVVARLSEPVSLSDTARRWYIKKLSGVIMPRAEQAVSSGNKRMLEELFSTGMLDMASLEKLLERSARSGRVPMTSVIMSLMRRTIEG